MRKGIISQSVKKGIPVFILAISSLLLTGCAAHSNLVPLGKGNIESNLGVGGPFIPLSGVKIPSPYFTLGMSYGLNERLNADATVHVTSFFYKVAGFDFGAAWFPYLNQGIIPAWGIQPRLMLFASMKSNISSRFRAYPLISNSAAWKLGTGLVYTGFDMVVPFTRQDYEDQTPHVIISPFAGYRWKLSEHTNLISEIKWHAANVEGNQLAAEYTSIGGYGALSVMFTLTRSF